MSDGLIVRVGEDGSFENLSLVWMGVAERKRIPKIPGTYQWRPVAKRWEGNKIAGRYVPIYAWIPGKIPKDEWPDIRLLPDIESFHDSEDFSESGATDDI